MAFPAVCASQICTWLVRVHFFGLWAAPAKFGSSESCVPAHVCRFGRFQDALDFALGASTVMCRFGQGLFFFSLRLSLCIVRPARAGSAESWPVWFGKSFVIVAPALFFLVCGLQIVCMLARFRPLRLGKSLAILACSVPCPFAPRDRARPGLWAGLVLWRCPWASLAKFGRSEFQYVICSASGASLSASPVCRCGKVSLAQTWQRHCSLIVAGRVEWATLAKSGERSFPLGFSRCLRLAKLHLVGARALFWLVGRSGKVW